MNVAIYMCCGDVRIAHAYISVSLVRLSVCLCVRVCLPACVTMQAARYGVPFPAVKELEVAVRPVEVAGKLTAAL